MKINIELLIGAVQEHFDNERSYRLECKKTDWWKRTIEERLNCMWHERNLHGSSNELNDLCTILTIDYCRLYTVARLARKWEQKRNWDKCFPAQAHEQQIVKYLSEVSKYPQTEVAYLHWKINEKAMEKKVA
ncbi:MAG: hypothetical protein AB7G87_09140 [Clostridia bacterium]